MRKENTMQKSFIAALTLLVSFSLASCSYKPNDVSIKKTQENLISKKASKEDLDFPSHDPSIVAGKKVYAQKCASCHGASPHKYLSKEYMRTRSPEQQYLDVTKGNLKGMPAFKNSLTRDERWDALMYVRSSILGYFDDGGAEYAKVNAIFGGNCAVCHGVRGDGDGPLHKELEPLPANFNDFHRLYTRSDDLLFERVSHGIPWTAMPAWKDRYDFDQDFRFDDKLRWKLVRYVRQFGFSQGIDRLETGRKKIEEFKSKVKAKKEGSK